MTLELYACYLFLPEKLSLVSHWMVLLAILFIGSGCATIYGWKIHAPGLLSQDFQSDIRVVNERVALYIPEGLSDVTSKDKGTWLSDPQTYYIGEAFIPMLVESFQHAFEEFILMEAMPTPEIMLQYGIKYLAVVDIEGFENRKHFGDQGLDLYTETTVFGPDLQLQLRYETRGASEAPKIFAKKGGPEVNLNHAIESNLRSVISYLQDFIVQERGAE